MRQPNLDSARIKIERANHHILDLDKVCHIFCDSDPCEVIPEENPQNGAYSFQVRHRLSIPPEIPCVLGDAVHNLRSALDHLICALIIANGNEICRKNAFPAPRRRRRKRQSRAERKAEFEAQVKGMSKRAIRAIRSLKPYKGWKTHIRVLHEMDITDKHRLLLGCRAGYVTSRSVIYDSIATREVMAHTLEPLTGPPLGIGKLMVLKNRTELFRMPTKPKMDPDVKLIVAVAFGESGFLRGRPVVPFLHQLSQLVSGIIESFA